MANSNNNINNINDTNNNIGGMTGEALVAMHPDLEALLGQHVSQYEKMKSEGRLWNRQFDESGINYDIQYLESILEGLKTLADKYRV